MRLSVKAVIAGKCCNYFRSGPRGAADWCEPEDEVCPIFATVRRCPWFETAVLPAWPDVAAEYAALAGQSTSNEPVVTRQAICRHCGEAFKALHNRQQYCSEECRRQGRKDYERRYKRGKRAPVSNAV